MHPLHGELRALRMEVATSNYLLLKILRVLRGQRGNLSEAEEREERAAAEEMARELKVDRLKVQAALAAVEDQNT